jgi:monoamine oxidase
MSQESKDKSADMSRRGFIASATAGIASASLASGAFAGQAETESSEAYDVVVIGGGFAGVTAARDASWRGHKTLLLEARPRLGGRTFTSSFGGHDDVDLGGKWLGWSQPHVWSEVMRYDVEIGESAGASATRAIWMDKGKRVEGGMDQYGAMFENAVKTFYAPSQEAFPRPFDPLYTDARFELDSVTAAEAIAKLDLSDVERGLATSLATINGHASPTESSYLDQLRWFSLGDFDVANLWNNLGRYRIKGGTKKLIDAIHADGQAELKLNSPVASVEQQGSAVRVTTKRGQVYSAKTVIVAVPLNCVADIKFSPAISSVKMRVSKDRHTGSGTKVYSRIKAGNPVIMGHGTNDLPLCFLWTEYDDPDSQIMVGFGGSPDLLDINDDDAVADAVHRYLPNSELIESFGYDWNLDPYSKGTWCMYRPNVLTESLEELQRPEGNVFFAGSDIANGWRGFIDGAVESGSRTAKDVDRHLSAA